MHLSESQKAAQAASPAGYCSRAMEGITEAEMRCSCFKTQQFECSSNSAAEWCYECRSVEQHKWCMVVQRKKGNCNKRI